MREGRGGDVLAPSNYFWAPAPTYTNGSLSVRSVILRSLANKLFNLLDFKKSKTHNKQSLLFVPRSSNLLTAADKSKDKMDVK